MKLYQQVAVATRRREPLPLVSADERDFWRRAVEIERARLCCDGRIKSGQSKGTLPYLVCSA